MKIPEINSELAEETGWHIGDGSMNFYNCNGKDRGIYQLRGHIEDDKLHYIERIKPVFESLYNLKINLREMPSTRVFGFQVWNNELVDFKHKLGLPLGKKFEVPIPKIFTKNMGLKTAVIRGIFDTDGGIYLEKKNKKLYPRIEIRTISSMLAEQLLNILTELRLRTTKHSELIDKEYNRLRIYVISIRGNEMFHKFVEIIAPKNQKHINKYLLYMKSFK